MLNYGKKFARVKEEGGDKDIKRGILKLTDKVSFLLCSIIYENVLKFHL